MAARVLSDRPGIEELLELCAGGDERALEDLYRLSAGHLFGIALRMLGRRDQAEDVLHEAFVQIWERSRTFDRTRGAGRAWIVAIVRYRALDALRRLDRRRGDADLAGLDIADPQPDAVDRLGLDEDLRRLYDCLERLTPDGRRCILMAYFDGCTHEEIAGRIERPLGTVKSWVRRGLLALRTCLEP
jgi:RNA polymerase sigma-70 factor (ECF subfamily)